MLDLPDSSSACVATCTEKTVHLPASAEEETALLSGFFLALVPTNLP